MIDTGSPAVRQYVASQLRRYWPRGETLLLELPVPVAPFTGKEPLPPPLVLVALPGWAADLAADGGLLVPQRFLLAGTDEEWRRMDWWGAAFWYLNGLAERAFENQHGPIHSYSFRLKGWNAAFWKRAWVNRIALFLRRWAARSAQRGETELLGPPPGAEIIVTHDVDAIRKTLAIRVKQAAFNGFNALRCTARGKLPAAVGKLASAGRFLFGSADYWRFEEVRNAEEKRGLRSCFYVYGGGAAHRSIKQALLDPAYDVREDRIARQLRALLAAGWQVGLHQSFEAWRDAAAMSREKSRVEEAIGTSVTLCRQHWLRFSWGDTWRAQQDAGLSLDATLGFNDRPAFRNGAALQFHPWDAGAGRPLAIAALPTVLMDSHLYDYHDLTEDGRSREMRHWVDEVRAVGGRATVIWHQHALADDYGWRRGFESFIGMVAKDLQ